MGSNLRDNSFTLKRDFVVELRHFAPFTYVALFKLDTAGLAPVSILFA